MRIMQLKRLVIFFSILSLLYAFTLLLAFIPKRIFYKSELGQGNEIIQKIEIFKNESNRLPDDLSELGILDNEDQRIFYRRDGKNYIIWFGMSLGESGLYDSRIQKWNIE